MGKFLFYLQLLIILSHFFISPEIFSIVSFDKEIWDKLESQNEEEINTGAFSISSVPLLPSSFQEDELQISMLSLNVWALPFWNPKTKQKRRYRQIPIALMGSDADVICIQEAFSRKLRKKLLPIMENKYFTGSNYLCNKTLIGPFKRDCYGGLITLSKFPIISEVFYPFPKYSNMKLPERFGRKGFLLTQIQSPSGIISVINTHLYSGNGLKDQSFRLRQLSYLRSIIALLPEVQANPIFLMGDLNLQTPKTLSTGAININMEYKYILDSLNLADPLEALSDDKFTIHRLNPYFHSNDGQQKLDYCLYSAPSDIQVDCTKSSTIFTGSNSISDHYGWFSTFVISNDHADIKRIAQLTVNLKHVSEIDQKQ